MCNAGSHSDEGGDVWGEDSGDEGSRNEGTHRQYDLERENNARQSQFFNVGLFAAWLPVLLACWCSMLRA